MRHILPTLLALLSLAAMAAAQDNDAKPIPCDGDLASIVEEYVEVLQDAVDDFIEGLEDRDTAIQALAIRWLGVANNDETEEVADTMRRMAVFDKLAAPLCHPQEDSETRSVIAYTHADDIFYYLMPSYFDLPGKGVPSQPGVIFHELSHLILFGEANPGVMDEI